LGIIAVDAWQKANAILPNNWLPRQRWRGGVKCHSA